MTKATLQTLTDRDPGSAHQLDRGNFDPDAGGLSVLAPESLWRR